MPSQGSSQGSQRKRQMILPNFQLRLVSKFVLLSMAALLCQFLFMGTLLTNMMRGFPGAEGLVREVPTIVFKTVVFMAVLQLPILFMGLILTFRIAGPVYRFESYLRSLARNQHRGPCTIRQKDEFSSLNDAINEVVEQMDQLRERLGEGRVEFEEDEVPGAMPSRERELRPAG